MTTIRPASTGFQRSPFRHHTRHASADLDRLARRSLRLTCTPALYGGGELASASHGSAFMSSLSTGPHRRWPR
jgi:hypothetical protein